MSDQKDSMIFYRSFYESVSELDQKSQGKIYSAIFDYSFNMKEPDLQGIAKTVFRLIKPQLDANHRRYENGSKAKTKQEGSEQEASEEQTGSKDEANKNKNVNVNDNKNDNNKYIEFLSYLNQLKGSQFKGSDKVRKSFNARLNDGYSLEDIKTATLKCFNTPYHQENTKYLTPEFILRPEKMEMYLNAKEPQEQQKPIPDGSKFTVGETDKLMTQ